MGRKAALYASFGMRELWVIDAVKLTARVFRDALAGRLRRDAGRRRLGPARPAVRARAFALRLDELDLS